MHCLPSRTRTEALGQTGPYADASTVRVCLTGELDLASRESFHRAIDSALQARPTAQCVELDLSELRFCDVQGLNALLEEREALRRDGRALVLRRAPRQLTRLLMIAAAVTG